MARRDEEVIELTAIHADGDLACDITIATEKERAGLPQALREHLLRPVRPRPDGVEVMFEPEGWDAVRRYIDLESRCCSFLTLRARRTDDAVILTVTGRPEAKPWIEQIFA
jgi:hypothetical protein